MTEPAPLPPLTSPKTWFWPFGLGAGLIALALVCFYRSYFNVVDNPMLIGLFMLIGGVAEGILAIFGRAWAEFVRDLAPALLYVIVGMVVMADPLTGSFWLTMILAAAFITGAVYRGMAWARTRTLRGWTMLAVAAGVTLVVWLLLVWAWPRSGIWVLGTVAGVGLALTGWSWIQRGWTARTAREEL
jgi:uncharacterized membrane protein HdeD (DUF308 family)